MDYYSLDDRKKLEDQLAIDNKALDDIISNQGKAEQEIIDNYNSLGPTLSRMVGAYASVRGGANPSQVIQNYSNQLDTRLNNARNKYKDDRDAAFQRVKDTLDRREKLAQAEYNKTRDQAKDRQWEQEFGLKTKTQADQNAIQQAQLDILRNQNTSKQNQAVQDQINQQNLEDAAYTNLEYLGNFALDPREYNRLSDNKRTKQATINLFNREYAKAMGVKEENIADWITENPSLPSMNDNFATQNAKMKALLLQAPGGKRAYTKQQEEKRKATFTETKKRINDATPGSFISFPSMPNEQFLVTVDKTLFKDGKEYKLDDDGKFIELK